jgi:predicted TIM-barrel fold metal-dependent hydrolase
VPVIDVDSHWEPPKRVDEGIDAEARVRALVGILAEDVLRQVPPDQRPPVDALASGGLREVFGGELRPSQTAPGSYDVPGRLAWCDEVGIDFQFVNQGGFTGVELAIPDPEARRTAIATGNDQLLGDLEAHQDRLSAVVVIDPADIDGAIAELERCRARGSRAYHLRAEPPGGVSYAHPHVDRLWAASVDLGMVAYLHIGNTPAYFDPGWANLGIAEPDGAGAAGLLRLSNSARTQAAETMVAALAYGGVFDRHPDFTLLVAELWAGWMPFLLMRLDHNTHSGRHEHSDVMLGAWPHEMSAGDYVRRNVRITPLPGLGDDGLPTLLAEPGMVVFSSDYPHLEGSATPIDDYEPELSELDGGLREAFLGSTMAECFDRMGDPLPLDVPSAR